MSEELVRRLLAGERRALARALTHVENRTVEGYEALRLLYPRGGHAHLIGVTGPAGSGKSTLADALTREQRKRGRTVGIVAVDPSSPFTQGAILGDRIRMQDHASDAGVFIRSMATRGSLGGLAETAGDVAAVLDAAGYDVVILETVGAGQDEVEVASMAQTTVVVNTPGYGDGVQMLKAGILEIADILVVNKADHAGTDGLVAELEAMLSLAPEAGYRPPILRTVASRDEGVPALADAIDEHRAQMSETGALARNQRARARADIEGAVRSALLRRFAFAVGEGALDEAIERVATRDLDPHTAARSLIERESP